MIRDLLNKTFWILNAQFGLDPVRFARAFVCLPWYFKSRRKFKALYPGRLNLMPCLHDRTDQAGAAQGEYFWQDLTVARLIFSANPVKHVDVGSRIDGFVAHVASFREIEVFDVRPMDAKIPNVKFLQMDLMQGITGKEQYCDSLSCLHALEHFGLGRYGDPINPDGFKRGIQSMATLLKTGGTFYLSVPIGKERVEFNAHRVFSPLEIVEACSANSMRLKSLTLVKNGFPAEPVSPDAELMDSLKQEKYTLGIFVFVKG